MHRKKIKPVTEFLPRKVYCSRIAITNSSEESYDLQIITEIPEGSLPVNDLEYSKSHTKFINGLRADTLQYYFYFPVTGGFSTFRPTCTIEGSFAGIASGNVGLNVINELTKVSKDTIQDILNTGSNEDI